MNKKSKVIALLVICVLLVSLFSGCNKKNEVKTSSIGSSTGKSSSLNSNNSSQISSGSSSKSSLGSSSKALSGTSSTPINNGKYDTSKVVKDLKGATIVYGSPDGWEAPYTSTESGKKQLAYFASIEKKYNCKIVYNNTYLISDIETSIAAGKPLVDLMPVKHYYDLVNYYKSRLIQPLEDIKVMNFDDTTKFDPNTHLAIIENKHYGVQQNFYGGWYSFNINNILFYNKAILRKNGYTVEDLNSLQKSGQWTWAKFEEIATKCVDESKDIIGIWDGGQGFYNDLLASNNADWITKKSDGNLSFTADSPNAKEALDFYLKLANKGVLKADNITQNWDKFGAGNCAFFNSIAAGLQWIPYIDINNTGVMYCPKGPKATDYKSRMTYAGFYAIPTGVKNPEAAATILAEMCGPFMTEAEYKTSAAKDISIYVSDTYSRDTLLSLPSRTVFSYAAILGRNSVDYDDKDDATGRGWYNYLIAMTKKTADFSQVIAGNKTRYNALLEELTTRY